MVMVITGDGKGKTTAAFGQALRAVGQGYKVCIIQFMKGRKYGEVVAIEKYLPDITIIQSGLDSFVMRDNPTAEDIALAGRGLALAYEVINSKKYDMIILDEITVAADFALISGQAVVNLINSKPPELDLVLTGRYAAEEVKAMADMVSEVTEIKHHYYAGIAERAGIEY
ncbi:MAG: cob(I)yrinic acid a,c-diamide adenosyltransferase [Firmicutes bacterium]|nr:cob(I)yrinic acid a,c-diamide adenosyltransferase [Bacillota bacterium]